MRKWILMLVCVLTLSALSVCFAEDSDNSGEVTAQQSYVNEAITVTSETSADAPSQSPVLRDVAYMTQGGRQLIIKLYDIDSDYDVSRLAEPDFEEGGLLYTHKNSIKVSDNRCCFSKRMRKVFRKNEKSMLQNCNKKAKRKGRLQRVKKPM